MRCSELIPFGRDLDAIFELRLPVDSGSLQSVGVRITPRSLPARLLARADGEHPEDAVRQDRPVPTAPRSFVVSLDNRKARGAGHERREEILAAARELFLEQGIENVTTRQIATRVGISQTAVYVYFKKKDQMLDALVDEAFRKLSRSLEALEDGHAEPVDYFRAAIPVYVRFGIENPDEYRLAFRIRDGRPGSADRAETKRKAVGFEVFATFEAHVAAGLAAGTLRSSCRSSRALAQAIWAAIHGLVALLLAYRDFDWVDLGELISVHTDMLLRGLLASPDTGAATTDVGKIDAPPRRSLKTRS